NRLAGTNISDVAITRQSGAPTVTMSTATQGTPQSLTVTSTLTAAQIQAYLNTSLGLTNKVVVTGVNEVQTLTVTGTAGSTFTLNFNGSPASAPLTFTSGTSPTTAQVFTHLNSIAALTNNVGVTGANG